MKRTFALLVALLLAGGMSGQAGATTAKKKRPHAGQERPTHSSPSSNPSAANGYVYYERNLDRVPFGSQVWWQVYDSMPKGR